MSRSSNVVVPLPATENQPADWRIERLQSLMGEDWLAGV